MFVPPEEGPKVAKGAGQNVLLLPQLTPLALLGSLSPRRTRESIGVLHVFTRGLAPQERKETQQPQSRNVWNKL